MTGMHLFISSLSRAALDAASVQLLWPETRSGLTGFVCYWGGIEPQLSRFFGDLCTHEQNLCHADALSTG